MPFRWTQRLQATWQSRLQRQSTPAQASHPLLRTVSQRTEVFPPERLYRPSRWRHGLREWLNTGWEVSRPALPSAAVSDAPTPTATLAPMAQLRAAFLEALDDVDTAQDVRDLITRARSPRELWHLRTAVYTLIATQHTEAQAQQRMDALNRHFPLRTFCDGLWSR